MCALVLPYKNMKVTRSIIPLIALCAVLVGYSYTDSWTAPTAAPPGNNTPAPLNVGSTQQTKNGSLIINGTVDANRIITNNVAIGICPHAGGCSWPHETFQLPTGNNFRWNIGGGQEMALHGDGRLWVRDRVQAPRVFSNDYCDAGGGNCVAPWEIPGGNTPNFVSFTNTRYQALGYSSDRVCMLTSMDTGGCDAGARCTLEVSGGGWVVNQERGGDCDYNMRCTYACW